MSKLSEQGINQLEEIMLANCEFYNQVTFGQIIDCGTVLCAAGFAHLLKIGKLQFDLEAASHTLCFSTLFATACELDGIELLEIDTEDLEEDDNGQKVTPMVFEMPSSWPDDLEKGFEDLRTGKERVEFYINMLRNRATKDGRLLCLEELDEAAFDSM